MDRCNWAKLHEAELTELNRCFVVDDCIIYI